MATDWLDNLFSVRKVFGRVGEVVATLGDYTASLVTYDNDTSGLTAETVQDAIDELADASGSTGQEYSEISVTGLSGTYNALTGVGFDSASSVNISAPGGPSITINGILAPSSDVNGLIKLLRFAAGSYTLTIAHNSGSAASGDKILCAGGHDIIGDGIVGDTYVSLTRVNGNWHASKLDRRELTFGVSRVALPTAAPTANYVMVSSSTSALSNVLPGTIMPRMSSSNTSTTARNFSQNRRETWNGGTAVSLTYGGVGAVDGCIETIFFPSSLGLVSFALSTDLDPTGTVAYAFDGGASAYLLTMQYFATGPCVVCSLRKVTDL